MKLFFVTGNPHKIKAAKKYLDGLVELQSIQFDLKEIQAPSRIVAIRKAQDAFKRLGVPLIVVDSSFRIKALKDFPDAYAHYVEETLKDDGILKLMDGEKNRTASYVDTLVYIDKYGYQVFESETKGKISEESFKGEGEPFDKIFIRDKDQYPVAYYDNLGDTIYENSTYFDFSNFLKKRRVSRGITFFGDKVLLLHRKRKEKNKYLEYYAIPGGGIEKDETPEMAVIREVKEETSIDVSLKEYLGMETYDTGVCYYFYTEYKSGEIELGGEEKENNNPDNFYETSLIKIEDLKKITTLGIARDMILKAYEHYKNNQDK